jgi:hypothetical protein
MHVLKIGDRVRVTRRRGRHGYRLGDKGTVLRGPLTAIPAGQASYLVALDRDQPVRGGAIFAEDEIEPDV